MTSISFAVQGLRLVNALNAREDWRARHRRVRAERVAVFRAAPGESDAFLVERTCGSKLRIQWLTRPEPPLVCSLTRVYPPRGKEMDTDGLAASFKAVRDAVAELLGVDDNPKSGVTWEYHQIRGSAWAVVIDIDSVAADAAAEGVLP